MLTVFSVLNRKAGLRGWDFRITIVMSATTFDLANQNSMASAYQIISEGLERLPSDRITLFMLGEVDAGYLIWKRAQQTCQNPYRLLEEVLPLYFSFLEQQPAASTN